MANKWSPQKKRKKVKMRTRMLIPLLLVVVFQLLTASAVLIFGGVFSDIEQYSYNTLVEKTENRATYIRDELQEKPALVQECAEEIDRIVTDILADNGASIAAVQTDEALVRSIIESSTDTVSALLKRAAVNDAYLILDTGSLYGDDGKAALYLRDTDSNSNIWNEALILAIGFPSIAEEPGFSRHSGWSQYFTPDPEDMTNFGFYYKTIETARENSGLAQSNLGYWSGFSRVTSGVTASMKYSLPLIAEDGTVYGVLGVGFSESAVLANIPAYDFLSETACYVLGYSDSGKRFDILTYSGYSYGTLLGGADTVQIRDKVMTGVYRFDMVTDVELSGSVQYIDLYDLSSPYLDEQWALISVADNASVLRPLLFLQRMLGISAGLSILVAAIVAVLGCAGLTRPISNASKLMRTKRKYNEVIRFQPSNIYEIDDMTDAITQLQINAQNFSSQVSKMISIADVGLGTFMYDRTDDSVFVGQSLISILKLDLPSGEDVVMSRQEFLDSIQNPEARAPIAAGLGMSGGVVQGDFSEVYRISRLSGGTLWMRLGYTYSSNTAIGIVQDITDTMLEKARIEHERDHDNLTGLLTRQAYYRRIEEVFRDRDELHITAFVMIDLDDLKQVNDTYGHDFGDDYIKTAAEALKIAQEHGGIVARLSGDEFNICLSGFSSRAEVRSIIGRVQAALMQSSCLLADGTHFKVSASIGVAWYPDDAESRELLMKYADFAMYTVKHSKKGGLAEFDKEAYLAASTNLTDVEELSRIIDNSDVKYAFQSIVSAKTGEIYGYEALMRPQSQIFQNPLELLRIAKSAAKLYEIERLTWMRSLEDFRELIATGQVEPTAYVFVNSIASCKLKPEDEIIFRRDFPDLLHQIVVEILEGESANEAYSAHKFAVIQDMGGKIALDDFGSGYNSEYALLNLQPNIIKIDRSIISGCDKDASRRMIIENLVKLAQTKDILVVAEGVETAEELETVIFCGVDLLQGHYLARPAFEPKPIAPALKETILRLANSDGASEGTIGSHV